MLLSNIQNIPMNNQLINPFLFVLLFVLVLVTLFGICYIYITSKSKERLALIERGMDPNLARSNFWAQAGIIGGGAALGLIAGDKMPGGYGPLIAIILAGAGIVIYNIISRNKARPIK